MYLDPYIQIHPINTYEYNLQMLQKLTRVIVAVQEQYGLVDPLYLINALATKTGQWWT